MARETALSRKIRSQLDFVRVAIPGALRKGGLEGLGEECNLLASVLQHLDN